MGETYRARDENLLALGFASYASYLAGELWRSIRKHVMIRDRRSCRCCRARANHVHHDSYAVEVLKGKSSDRLYAVCKACHEKLEFRPDGTKRSFEEVRQALRSMLGRSAAAKQATKRSARVAAKKAKAERRARRIAEKQADREARELAREAENKAKRDSKASRPPNFGPTLKRQRIDLLPSCPKPPTPTMANPLGRFIRAETPSQKSPPIGQRPNVRGFRRADRQGTAQR